ncbi:hypothetical protein J1605_001738 [Eschrichtius robustus]|uniref:Heparan-sulfate 6-O-sulfotransferase n=1 Tax=Eschrichtius robustus TaxID=9764 RepID=A0AB34I0J3_ESCRO|nr:hypothetical protein J1605_001738 [Eschrichtius robustus]
MLRTPRRLRAFLAQGSIVKLKTERRQLQSFSFDFTFQVEALPSSSSFVDVSCQGSRGHVPLLCALKRIRGFPPPGDTSQESTGEVWREGEKRQQSKTTNLTAPCSGSRTVYECVPLRDLNDSLQILSTLSCLKGVMALPACAARALGPPLQPEREAPARTTCPRRHSRVEAELAASRPGSVAASVRAGPPRGVSRGFNSQPLLDEPLKASSSLAGAARAPLFALLARGRRRRMHDLRRRWDLGSLCRALLTRGLAALGHSLKHVLGAIFSKIFGPLASVGNMDEKSNKLLLALVMLFLFAVIVLQYVCPGTECQLLRLQAFSSPMPDPYRSEDESSARFVPRYNFSRGDLLRKVDFDIKGDDLIVFLHIQKTGGTTFGRHLVRNIQLEQPCECRVGQKKCTCHRPGKRETWLFSRFSTGWSCGLHADWTELTSCVPAVVDGKRDARLRPSRESSRYPACAPHYWLHAGHQRRFTSARGTPRVEGQVERCPGSHVGLSLEKPLLIYKL